MNTIKFQGRHWRLHSETATKIVFVPAANLMAKWRKKQGLNQRAAANALGISQSQVARIESGTRVCPTQILELISK
jgi:predicted transcriptional regulator